MKKILLAVLATTFGGFAGQARAEDIVLVCKKDRGGDSINFVINDRQVTLNGTILNNANSIEISKDLISFQEDTENQRVGIKSRIDRITGVFEVYCFWKQTNNRRHCPRQIKGTCEMAETTLIKAK
jgi:hypothetical protein